MLGAGGKTRTALALAACALATTAGISYAHPLGHTTEQHTIASGPPIAPGSDFNTLVEGPGAPRVVRPLPTASALAGRQSRRGSLSYFAQLTDFQLADEESPARVEFTDPGASAAFRPHEGLHPWAIDFSFRQLNQFTGQSPHQQAGGRRAAMDFGLVTGDNSDNQQLNETAWVRDLIEGRSVPENFNSGTGNFGGTSCTALDQTQLASRYPGGAAGEAPRYTGVQDYDDVGVKTDYYDPDQPAGQYSAWPRYPGLMDRAQSLAFAPVGLRRGSTLVPTFVTNGNHDGLVQGNEDASALFEQVAIGCRKIVQSTSSLPFGTDESPNPNFLHNPVDLAAGVPVPPDTRRQFVDRRQLKQVYSSGIQPDDHGFAYVEPAENAASGGSATYFARDLKPGIRFISVDTVSDGGTVQDSANGNIDHPQFRWLESEIARAEAQNKLVVVFGHHPIRSLDSNTVDEAASPCTTNDAHGHDVNPGCDLDPRSSAPLHQGQDRPGAKGLATLLNEHPSVVAYVAGHTHENKVLACGTAEGCPARANWWEINTSAGAADWPQQSRLIELMDNRDGTLSLFGTLTDFAAPLPIPASGTSASGFGSSQMGSLSHAIAFNDPQGGDGTGEGAAQDQNVELLVDNPRTNTIRGTAGDDVIRGTPGDDVILCGDGDDRVDAGPGNDIVRCGRGNDVVFGGDGDDQIFGESGSDRLFGQNGADRVSGGSGRDGATGGSGRDRVGGGSGGDRLRGGTGNDRLTGRSGNDRINGDGGNDRLSGASGKDRMNGDSGRDRVAGDSGNDRVSGGPSRDRLAGGSGRDRLRGQSGNDRASGGSGNDRVGGDSGNDRLRGDRGNDRLSGGRGRDVLIGGPGRDRLRGGPGRDRGRQ